MRTLRRIDLGVADLEYVKCDAFYPGVRDGRDAIDYTSVRRSEQCRYDVLIRTALGVKVESAGPVCTPSGRVGSSRSCFTRLRRHKMPA
jgi:hypothetical protein